MNSSFFFEKKSIKFLEKSIENSFCKFTNEKKFFLIYLNLLILYNKIFI